MTRYVPTSLRFTEETFRKLMYEASRRGKSLASLVRESVDRYLGRPAAAAALEFGEDPMDRWIGAIASSRATSPPTTITTSTAGRRRRT